MPRVGSSMSTTRGWVASQRARTTFCWLPPERNCASWSIARAETSSEERMPGTSRRAADVRRGKTARTTPRALSRIVWLSARPVALRSSVIIARPDRIAWRGERGLSGLPSSSISPRVNGRTPKIASSSSVRPDPWRPEMPTISPARRVRSTPSTYPLPALRSSRRGSPGSTPSTLSGKNDEIERPTMSRTSDASSSSAAGWVVTCWPSFRTVMVSQRSKTSLRRWET